MKRNIKKIKTKLNFSFRIVFIFAIILLTNSFTNTAHAQETMMVDPNASSLELFTNHIEPINQTYYQNTNLSPVHAAYTRVTLIEENTGITIPNRNVQLQATPSTNILIKNTSCTDIYQIGTTAQTTTDAYGTACFLIWHTGTANLDTSNYTITAIADRAVGYGTIQLTDTETLIVEPMAITSILNYRFRNDDGDELTATPLGEVNTPLYNATKNIPFRLRIGITRLLEEASDLANKDEFTLSNRAQIGPRPIPEETYGISAFRAFPGFAIDENTDSLYLATANQDQNKARIYKYNLNNLSAQPTSFDVPETMSPGSELTNPIDSSLNVISKMFIDSEQNLMYFVVTPGPISNQIGSIRVYKIDLNTNQAIDVFKEENSPLNRSLDSEIDLDKGFLYLIKENTGDVEAIEVLKIKLNDRNAEMTQVGALQLENDSEYHSMATSSVIDLTNQFLYLSAGNPQKIFKVDLNVADSLPPVKVDEIALVPIQSSSPAETVSLQGSVIDPIEGYAYFAGSGTDTTPDNIRMFITKVDIAPNRKFEVISRLNLLPEDILSDSYFNAHKVYLPFQYGGTGGFGSATLDRLNGYAYFPLIRVNFERQMDITKLMRINLPRFTRDSNYDELIFPKSKTKYIKGTAFSPKLGRGYMIRRMEDGDWLYEFNSTTRQNFKLQSAKKVDPLYCNYNSNDLYEWQDIPNSDFNLHNSTYLTDGDPSTNVTGLLYDKSPYFHAGEIKDTSSTTGQISIGRNEFTEIEYSLIPTSTAKGSYCFRLIDADPQHNNQVSGHPNQMHNIINSEFNPNTFNYYIPLTIDGIELSKNTINIVEGVNTDSYGIRLKSQPTNDVTITASAQDNRLKLSSDLSPGTSQETTVTFDSTNWNTWKYINVSASNNEIIDGTSINKINHSSTSTDPSYNNIIIKPIKSIVTDYGATTSNVLATVSGTISFTPPANFSFPSVDTTASTPNFSPTLTVNIEEGRGQGHDFVLTMQTDGFCTNSAICLPLNKIYLATSSLINSFNTFTAAQIGQFMANYLQNGESLNDRNTYVHANPSEDRTLNTPITLFDSRNIPSGNSDNPLQGTIKFNINLMIDFANITNLIHGQYTTILNLDLNTNPL